MAHKKDTSWHAPFIAQLAKCPNVSDACSVAKITRTLAYHTRKTDIGFRRLWHAVMEGAVDSLEQEAMRRAKEGVEEPVFQGGKQVGVIRKYSDILLIFLLKAHRPKKYRDNTQDKNTLGLITPQAPHIVKYSVIGKESTSANNNRNTAAS